MQSHSPSQSTNGLFLFKHFFVKVTIYWRVPCITCVAAKLVKLIKNLISPAGDVIKLFTQQIPCHLTCVTKG